MSIQEQQLLTAYLSGSQDDATSIIKNLIKHLESAQKNAQQTVQNLLDEAEDILPSVDDENHFEKIHQANIIFQRAIALAKVCMVPIPEESLRASMYAKMTLYAETNELFYAMEAYIELTGMEDFGTEIKEMKEQVSGWIIENLGLEQGIFTKI